MSFDLKIKNGDLSLGATKDIDIVENGEKLTQDVLKIILTPLGGNPFFPWYGSPISQSLVGAAYETNFIASLASNQLRGAIEKLQNMQKEQMRSTNQIVTAQEQIAAVQNINVERNATDPRFFGIVLTVISKAFQRVQTQFNVRL